MALVALGGALGRRWSPLVAVGRRWSPLVAVGRRWSPLVAPGAAPLCVAGVALGDIHLDFAWQALHLESSTCVWRGRRGTCCTRWRAWSPLFAVGRPGRRATLHGSGTWRHVLAFGVAGVALGDIYLRLAWQEWHLLHLVERLVAVVRCWQVWHLVTSTCVLRGRRGTWSRLPAFVEAGVALGGIHLRFAWQAWHLETLTSTCVCRGRCSTCCTCWRSWSPLVAVGRPGRRAIYLCFTWLAWHLESSTCVWRGRRRTCCTWWRAWSPFVARHFACQAWHLETSTFVSPGWRR